MVRLHPHAREHMQERGAIAEEIQATVANEQLQRDATGRLLIINEATGERAEFPLAVA